MTIKVSFWNLNEFVDEFIKRHSNVEVFKLNDEMDNETIQNYIQVSDYIVIPHHSCSATKIKDFHNKMVFIVPNWHTTISEVYDDLAVSLFGPSFMNTL